MLALLLSLALQTADGPPPETMAGDWSVNLAVDPSQPYRQPMKLTLNEDKTVSGEFYNSPILSGRWKQQNGRLCVAFTTSDGAGPYHTSACIIAGAVQGQTWAEHRSLLFNWTAVRP